MGCPWNAWVNVHTQAHTYTHTQTHTHTHTVMEKLVKDPPARLSEIHAILTSQVGNSCCGKLTFSSTSQSEGGSRSWQPQTPPSD